MYMAVMQTYEVGMTTSNWVWQYTF
jgi:hypothetical protein